MEELNEPSLLKLVALVIAVNSAKSSVSAQKCWCGVMFGVWQCCGKRSLEPEI
jgi:hypothetical protein